jgi:hypothetical protein
MNREELLKRKTELRQRLEAIRRDLAGGLESDLEAQAQQLENYDTLLEIARVAEEELARVEQALSEANES